MAHRKKGKQPPALKRYWAAKRAGRKTTANAPMRRAHKTGRKGWSAPRRVKHLVHNPPSAGMQKYFRIPTMPEIGWSLAGTGLPVVFRFLTNLIPVDQIKSGPGNIALEFGAGNVIASVIGSRVSAVGGNILFILNLARAESRVAFLASGGMVGLADGVESPGLTAYVDEAMGATDEAMLSDGGMEDGGMEATDETQLLTATTEDYQGVGAATESAESFSSGSL